MGDPRAWHDLFMLTGAASATLAGLIFVAISFAAGSKPEGDSDDDLSTWVTPNLTYFGEVFIASAATLSPLSLRVVGVVALIAPAVATPFGLRRLGSLLRSHHEEALGLDTWLWQLVLPATGQAALAAGAIAIVLGESSGLIAMAGAAVALLATAVRNAWMLVVYLLQQRARATSS